MIHDVNAWRDELIMLIRRIRSTPNSEDAIICGEQAEMLVDGIVNECKAARTDADLFTALRNILAFNDGVFLLKDDDGRITVGVPVETICYAKLADGWDEREAVLAAHEAHKVGPPREREVVRP